MWNSKEENVSKELNQGGEWINKSGCYGGNIVEAEIVNSSGTQAKAVKLVIETAIGKCSPTLWYKKKDGTDNEYAIEKLDRLKYLCKVKNVEASTQDSKTVLPCFIGKEVGVFLEVRAAEKGHNYEVKDFYEPKSQKTSDELINKKEAKNFKYWNGKFKDAAPVENKPKAAESAQQTSNAVEEDEFPF